MSHATPTAALLVPIGADALIMNPYVRTQWTEIMWRRFTPNWQGFAMTMASPYGDNIDFTSLTDADDGVYLHWSLPSALRRATVTPTTSAGQDSVSFPSAPNRWLLVRIGPLANGTRPLRAWVIQSDYLTGAGSSGTPGTSAFVHPFRSQAGQLVAARLGMHTDITAYTGDLPSDSTGRASFLVASGPGDVSFAAYQPGANDVFAFFDRDIVSQSAGSFDYLIAGWHAAPSGDPLAAGGDWSALLSSLDWSVLAGPAAPGKTIPPSASFTVYHSVITNLGWLGVTQPDGPQPGVPSPRTLSVYVGSTTLNALCAAVQQKAGASGPQDVQHLQALMMGMLPQIATPQGALQVQEAIERSRFASADGGTQWAVTAYQPHGTQLPPLTPAQQQKLDALNANQAQFDALTRQLASKQWELYAAWWKSIKAGFFYPGFNVPEGLSDAQWGEVPGVLTRQIATLSTAVTTLMNQVGALAPQVPPAQTNAADLYTWAHTHLGLDPAYTIKALLLPRYFQPIDPVVLVTGLPPSMKYANQNSNPPGGLPCRFNAQIVAGIDYQGEQNITAASLGALLQVPSNSALPAAVLPVLQALVQEMFFLDAHNASAIAHVLSGVNATALQQQMQGRQNLLGTAPYALAASAWSQPFSPIYLEWQVEYVPTPLAQMNGWSFNGDDYTYTGTLTKANAAPTQTYSGRGVITPHAADLFRQRLQEYKDQAGPGADPALIAVLNLLGQLNTPDMLSQALSGLHNVLMMRDPRPAYPPPAPYASQIGYEFHVSPYTDLVPSDPRGARWFFPIRAGFFRFKDLRVIDAFGQTLDLLAANGNPVPTGTQGEEDHFTALGSPELVLDSSTATDPALNRLNWLRLPTRAAQAARLDVSLIPADGVTGTPVHGWLVPNHLDKAISVYDASGHALGEVMAVLSLSSGAPTTGTWVPAPVLPGSGFQPPARYTDITEPVLRSVVSWLIQQSSDGRLMRTFFAVIDETLWSVNPLGQRADANLSVLMGQPLAVVNVQLHLALHDEPAIDQSFTETLNESGGATPESVDLLTQPFSIQLGDLQRGDDGVIGYFTGAFDVFNAAVDPTTVDPDPPSGSVRVIGRNGNWLTLTYAPGHGITVTALLDPRGSIHARTGALPVTTTVVPHEYTEAALAALSTSFRTGPLLSDPQVVRIPMPAEQNGQWAWLGHQSATGAVGALQARAIVPGDQSARLSDQAAASEGWLQFRPKSATPNL
jgi:hypothetical protein